MAGVSLRDQELGELAFRNRLFLKKMGLIKEVLVVGGGEGKRAQTTFVSKLSNN